MCGTLQRVAGAWSRANFPPAALDSMFRAVEAVYRINKSLLSVRSPPVASTELILTI